MNEKIKELKVLKEKELDLISKIEKEIKLENFETFIFKCNALKFKEMAEDQIGCFEEMINYFKKDEN